MYALFAAGPRPNTWRYPTVCPFIILVSFIAHENCVAQPEPSASGMQEADRQWNTELRSLIEVHCFDCHSGEDGDGNLDLSMFDNVSQMASHRRIWQTVMRRIRDHEMPPPDGPELTDADRQKIVGWLQRTLPRLRCDHSHHAGPVTMRRLTRYEYKRTVHDLLGIDTVLADDFPADEEGYGFDNIGDVQSISPLLLEKYVAAAESIAEQVIFDPAHHRLDLAIDGRELDAGRGSRAIGGAKMLYTSGTLTGNVNVPVGGRYKIVVEAFGQHAGEEWIEMGLAINGRQVATDEVKSTDRKPSQHSFEQQLDEGPCRLGISFNNDFYDPDNPERDRRDRNLVVVKVSIAGPLNLRWDDLPLPHRRFVIAHPSDTLTEHECVQQIVSIHGSRAIRRQMTANEVAGHVRMFRLARDNGESFEGGLKVVLQSILVSPHFLFKIETATDSKNGPQRLSGFEMATAMSYFLWSTMPDDQLFRLAAGDELFNPTVLEQQIDRMLADDRSKAIVESFASQWLQLRLLESIEPDPEQFGSYTEHLRGSMIQETKRLVSDVISNNRSLKMLLRSDYTYLNRALARHYGMPTKGLKPREFTKVSLDEGQRGGLLTHASILTLTSNPTRTSPVKRGKWVLENLLAAPPPPALPDVPQLDSQTELVGTLRQRMEQHRQDPNCAVCHRKMDAIGFALENYDAIGRLRTEDDGRPIDARGEMPDGTRFAGAIELQQVIAEQMYFDFVRCICEKLFIYAVGRAPTPRDDCVIDEIASRAIDKDFSFGQVIKAIIQSEAFQFRTFDVMD